MFGRRRRNGAPRTGNKEASDADQDESEDINQPTITMTRVELITSMEVEIEDNEKEYNTDEKREDPFPNSKNNEGRNQVIR